MHKNCTLRKYVRRTKRFIQLLLLQKHTLTLFFQLNCPKTISTANIDLSSKIGFIIYQLGSTNRKYGTTNLLPKHDISSKPSHHPSTRKMKFLEIKFKFLTTCIFKTSSNSRRHAYFYNTNCQI